MKLLLVTERFEGFKCSFLSNDETLIDKLLYDVNKSNKKDNKINLVTVQLSLPAYEKLKENELKLLTTTAQDLFHVLAKFIRYSNVKTGVKLRMVDDELQKINTSMCGNFQFYFYKNLFDAEKNSKIQHHKKLTKKTIETLLNEIFTLDQNETECRVCEFSEEVGI